jgi:hypothetical protein
MNTEIDSALPSATGGDFAEGAALERRIFRLLCGVVALAVCVSLVTMPWRVTSGIGLGGVLSLVNFAWVRSFIHKLFGSTDEDAHAPRWSLARYYFLRYFVLAFVIVVAYLLNLVSLVAVLVGLCSFAVAGMIEGLTQLYFAIFNRTDSEINSK